MNENEIIEFCDNQALTNDYIDFPIDVFNAVVPATAAILAKRYGSNTMMRLPAYEIKFFEWLKIDDEPVWLDLWGDPEAMPYTVGMSFLPMLVERSGRGFPICDLQSNDNYYFSMELLPNAESKIFLESSKELFLSEKPLSISQLLVVEISIGPIDIWHFAYKHRLNLSLAKESVNKLVDDNVLVHLKNSEHLAGFIDW